MTRLAACLPLLTLALSTAPCAVAQHDHGTSPYAELAEREIKALGAEEIEGLLGGEGMGMALAAELNGFPGPRHVLELAGELGLSDVQRASVRAVFDSMSAEARVLGERIVALERQLDRVFASGEVTPETLSDALGEIAAVRGRLRFVHLRAHLQLSPILTELQRMAYRHARGYTGHH